METESLRMLRQRVTDIKSEVAALRAEILPLEFELQQVEAAIVLMTSIPAKGAEASRNAIAHNARQANPGIELLTMKQLVTKALAEHFPNGATAIELLDIFGNRWGRSDVVRTSLSPQLSRLKDEGKIELRGRVWHLVRKENEPHSRSAGGSDADLSDAGTVTVGLDQPIPHTREQD